MLLIRRIRVPASATLLLTAVACSTAPERASEVESWTLATEAVVTSGLEDTLFFGVREVFPLDDSTLVVADHRAHRLVWWRDSGDGGRPILTTGREGEGPGEFQSMNGVLSHPDGVMVLDAGLRRVTVYSVDGTLIGSTQLEMPEPSAWFASVGEGGLAAVSSPMGQDFKLHWTDEVGTAGNPTWRTLALSEVGLGDGNPVLAGTRSQRILVGMRERYDIAVLDTDGDLAARLTRDLPRKHNPEQRMTPFGPTEDSIPHFSEFEEDECGRFWVRTLRGGAGTSFDLFDPDGTYRGEVHLEAQRLRSFSIRGNDLFGALAGVDGWIRAPLGAAQCPR